MKEVFALSLTASASFIVSFSNRFNSPLKPPRSRYLLQAASLTSISLKSSLKSVRPNVGPISNSFLIVEASLSMGLLAFCASSDFYMATLYSGRFRQLCRVTNSSRSCRIWGTTSEIFSLDLEDRLFLSLLLRSRSYTSFGSVLRERLAFLNTRSTSQKACNWSSLVFISGSFLQSSSQSPRMTKLSRSQTLFITKLMTWRFLCLKQ